MFFDYQKAQRMKERYPSGTRIRLNSMDDPYAPIAPGTEGTVNFVDDIGTYGQKKIMESTDVKTISSTMSRLNTFHNIRI